MVLSSYANSISTNRSFIKNLLNMRDIVNKLGINPNIYFFNEDMNDLNLNILSMNFTQTYRKGLKKDKVYLLMNVLSNQDYFFKKNRK